jgi:molecular chaperone GrpE
MPNRNATASFFAAALHCDLHDSDGAEMSDPMKPDEEPKVDPAATPAPEAATEPETAGSGAQPGVSFEQLKEIIKVLQGEIDQGKNERLLLLADMENLRKRTEREKEETAKYAITRFAKDIVDVGDNFQRAIQAVPAKAAEEDPALKSFLEGVTLAERAFLAVLERHGVRQINPIGEPFNPHQHQAVMEVTDASVAAGTVTQVLQAGFVIEDRCLRPAMVAVAKGGPKAAKAAEAPAAEPPGQPNEPKAANNGTRPG